MNDPVLNYVDQLLAGFSAHRRRVGHADSSTRRNGHYLRDFAQWVGNRSPSELTVADIDCFLNTWCEQFTVRNSRAPAPKTVRNLMSELRAFYDYLDRRDLLLDADGHAGRNPMPKIELPKIRYTIRSWLEPEEIQQMVDAAATPAELFTVDWLYGTALRIGEASHVPWQDVDLTRGSILIRSGKTQYSARRIAMPSDLWTYVQRHRMRQRERGLADPTTPVFCTRYGNPVTEQQANRTLRRLAQRAGIKKKVTCHTLRRSWAMHAVTKMSLEAVAAHLGHVGTATTARHYAQVQFPQVEAEVRRAFG